MNKVLLVGRIAKTNEVKTFEGGSCNMLFSVATSESFKKGGEWTEEATFHQIKAWNKTAEYIENHIRKGDLVEIEGQIKIDQWEKDGEKKSFNYINLNRINRLMKSKPKEGSEQVNNQGLDESDQQNLLNAKKAEVNQDFAGDDIPF